MTSQILVYAQIACCAYERWQSTSRIYRPRGLIRGKVNRISNNKSPLEDASLLCKNTSLTQQEPFELTGSGHATCGPTLTSSFTASVVQSCLELAQRKKTINIYRYGKFYTLLTLVGLSVANIYARGTCCYTLLHCQKILIACRQISQ